MDSDEIIIVGLDPGKQKDSFAMVRISIIEKKIYVLGAKHWLGKPYLQVEEDIAELHELHPANLYVVERNNVGDHVIEVLQQKDLPIMGVTTSKDIKNRNKHRDTMDKNEMVLWMIATMQEGKIIFPAKDTAETAELKRQLSIFSERKTASGSVSYGAEGSEHDDYVMALMLACFGVRKKYLRRGSGRHFAVSSKGRPYYYDYLGIDSESCYSTGRREIWYPPGSF